MPKIHLTCFILAPVERVFDLSRNIDLHKKSMAATNEEAIAGTTNGLIQLGDTVTWKGKHLGKTRFHKSKITALRAPVHFIDEMMEGDFKSFVHNHHFKPVENGTIMIDELHYEMPYGMLGRLMDRFYLYNYLVKLLETRNLMIKQTAESERWRQFL
ncbi:SRPBCC family protein [Flavihumibacter sp. CACIAM 22H1]|uniref:SRPBCC family protein n=1 Tax=Flavihumibacter sp. CACIAM 22H1 TaxID=1812911 RepID=UPI0007A825EA|nr:SRPBCC family protein [Flavihumibacter sp. CACIAM 22H1]KYP13723.1 MAG: cell division protein [Flavihumibacter sp. CACIAM 22H1]